MMGTASGAPAASIVRTERARRLLASAAASTLGAVTASPPTVTVGTSGGGSAITSPQTFNTPTARTTSLGGRRRSDGSAFFGWINDASATEYAVAGVGDGFMFDGQVFEFSLFAYAVTGNTHYYRLRINGQWATAADQPVTADGGTHRIKVDFGSRAVRRIEVFFASAALITAYAIGKNDRMWPLADNAPRLIGIGDSWMGDNGAASVRGQLLHKLGEALGVPNPYQIGLGGTGFVQTAGKRAIGDSIAVNGLLFGQADVLLLFNSQNDYGAYAANPGVNGPVIQAAITAGAAAAMAQHPNAFIIALSSTISLNAVGSAGFNAAGLAGFAAAFGTDPRCLLIDTSATNPGGAYLTLGGDMTTPTGNGNSDFYFGTDHAHMNDAGCAYYAGRIAAEFVAVLKALA